MKKIEKAMIQGGALKLHNCTLWYEYSTKLFMYSDDEYNHASANNLKELKEVVKEVYNIEILTK